MATPFHGVNVNFGVSSGITSPAVIGLFQTLDHTHNQENETIKNGTGDFVQKNYFGFSEAATFDYVSYDNSGINGSGSVVIPTVGSTATVVDDQYPAIAGTWLVDDVAIKGTNTTSKRITTKLSRYPFINN